MEYQINILKILDKLRENIPGIIVFSFLGFLIGFLLTAKTDPDVYRAISTIYSASYSSYKDSVEGRNVMRDYVDIVGSRKVAERASVFVENDISVFKIMQMVSASYENESAIMTIMADSEDPALAVETANAVTNAFVAEVHNITAVDSVKVLDSAYEAEKIVDGQRSAFMARVVSFFAGAFMMIAYILVKTVFDTRVSSVEEVTLNGEIELLSVLPVNDI